MMISAPSSRYFVLGPWHHKSFEVGYQLLPKPDLELRFGFTTQGDHAGLRFHMQVGRTFVELSFHDVRHWNDEAGRFYEPNEEQFDKLL